MRSLRGGPARPKTPCAGAAVRQPGGRLEFGTGRSATWTELGGMGADPDETRGCLEKGGRMPFLAQEILFDKVSDFLVERYFRE